MSSLEIGLRFCGIVDIRAWIQTWNDDPKPYVWVKTADEILDSVASYCRRITDSEH